MADGNFGNVTATGNIKAPSGAFLQFSPSCQLERSQQKTHRSGFLMCYKFNY